MTRRQRIVCIFLCLCMLGGFIVYMPSLFHIPAASKQPRHFIFRALPIMGYCESVSASEPVMEDAQTYQAIVEANRAYLAQQVIGENGESLEAQEEEQQEVREETPEETAEATPEETLQEQETADNSEEAAAVPVQAVDITREQLEDYDYLLNNFFILDGNTATDSNQINAAALLDKDMSLPAEQAAPQILIYHSHSQEEFADSVPGDPSMSVIGVGDTLMSILQEDYGYGVMHVTDTFDIVNGEIDRNSAYDYAREKVEQVLAENPSIEVVIDLHRDGVPEEKHLVTEVDGRPTAQFMFFNGLSYSAKNGPIDYLPNPHIADNLAFSFQLELNAEEYYPGLCRAIYLSSLRYNLHLKARAILLEVGAQNNTVEEAKNAMIPFAWILNKVLKGE